MLLTTVWQLIATDGNVLVQKSNKSGVSLCYSTGTPTTESTFGLDTRDPIVFPVSTLPNKDLYARVTTEDANCTLTVEEVRKDTPASAGQVTVDYTGTTTIPADKDRQYFFIQMKSGTCTLSFGGGPTGVADGVFIDADGFYEPFVAPAGDVVITTTGSFVLVLG